MGVAVGVMVVVGAGVPIPSAVHFVFLPGLLSGHLEKGDLAPPANGAAEQGLQVAVRDVSGRVVIREVRGGLVVVEAVERWKDAAGASWGHSKVRHNFGYTGPLLSGVSWHLLKRRRRREGRRGGGGVTAKSAI